MPRLRKCQARVQTQPFKGFETGSCVFNGTSMGVWEERVKLTVVPAVLPINSMADQANSTAVVLQHGSILSRRPHACNWPASQHDMTAQHNLRRHLFLRNRDQIQRKNYHTPGLGRHVRPASVCSPSLREAANTSMEKTPTGQRALQRQCVTYVCVLQVVLRQRWYCDRLSCPGARGPESATRAGRLACPRRLVLHLPRST